MSKIDYEDSLDLYFKEIKNIPYLTQEEEQVLFSNLTDKARERLIESNLKLVVSIAKKYSNYGLNLADLIQEGNCGLLYAIDKFDTSQGNRFSTFASWWIKHYITRALTNQSRLIRLPAHIAESLNSIKSLEEENFENAGNNISPKILQYLTNSSLEVTSYDVAIGEDSEDTLLDLIEDETGVNPETGYIAQDNKEIILNILKTLSKREQEVLMYKFGLNGAAPCTLDKIGEKMKLSKERIRQIEVGAMRKLRQPSRAKMLKETGLW